MNAAISSATMAGTVARRIIGPAALQDAYQTSFDRFRSLPIAPTRVETPGN